MERVHGTNKLSKSALEEDVINRMPDNVITNILNRLPIMAAVWTSILSSKWRFNWTLLTHLIFDYDFLCYLADKGCYDLRDIVSRFLLHLIGPVTTFHLYILYNTEVDADHINHWLMCLSRKGIKDFVLINGHDTPLKLHTHLFSCLQLEQLTLHKCSFHPPPSFHGFPNLLTLDLSEVTGINNYVVFIKKCPLLEILKLSDFRPIGKVKLAEIAKLENLRVLSLPLCMLDDVTITSSVVFQLEVYLPKLQELSLNFRKCTFFGEAGVRKWAGATFPCLKTLTLDNIDFGSASMLSFAFEMIWSSPNLQTLEITATYNGEAVPPPAFCFPEVDNNIKLQIRSVVFSSFRGSENEVYLIKSLLACSPLLQNSTIHVKSSKVFGGDNGKFIFAKKLLELDRASPKAKVKLY